MVGRKRDLARPPACIATKPVDDAPVGDRHQPRAERTRRIVGMAHHVNCQEHILHGIFHIR